MKTYIVAFKPSIDRNLVVALLNAKTWKEALHESVLDHEKHVQPDELHIAIADNLAKIMDGLPNDLSQAMDMALDQDWEFNIKEVTMFLSSAE